MLKILYSLAIPIIISNLLQTTYQLIDTFWVGRLGSDAIATISISYPILFLMLTLGSGLAIAGTILVSQYKGKNDTKSVNYVSSQTIVSIVIIAISIAIIGIFLSPIFIKIMGAKEGIFKTAVSYLQLSFIGGIFIFTFMVFQSLLQGIGIVKPQTFIILTAVCLNAILDPLFIFKLKLGVNGAAIATIITQGLAAITGLIILFTGKYEIKIMLRSLKFDLNITKKIFKLGIPISIEYSSRALCMVVITAIVSSFGTNALAVYGIGIRLFTFVVLIGVGFATATSTLVGQNFGANNVGKAYKISKMSLLNSLAVFLFLAFFSFIFSSNISSLFIPKEPIVIQETSLFIKILSSGFIALGVQIALNGIFKGSGNPVISMALTLLTMWILRAPLAFILSKLILKKEIGIWLSFPISNYIAAIVGLIIFIKGKWKEKKII